MLLIRKDKERLNYGIVCFRSMTYKYQVPSQVQEVAEFCLFNQDFGRKYVWSCGILSFLLLEVRIEDVPVIVIETFHDGKPFPALKKIDEGRNLDCPY